MKYYFREQTQKSLKIAFPVILTQVGQILVNIVDVVMVGKLSSDKIAAVSLGNSVFIMVLLFSIGFSFSLSPLVSQSHAKNEVNNIQHYFKHGMILNLILAIIITIFTMLAMPIMDHLKQPKEVLPDAKNFLLINLFSLVPVMIFQTYRQVSEGISVIYVLTFTTISANIINIFFNYCLIYGNWGFPRLEVSGSAWATFISRLYMLLILMFLLYRNKKTRMFFVAKWNGFSKSIFRKIAQLGFPTAFQLFFEVTAFAAAAYICGYGEQKNQLSAHQITITLASVTFMVCTGLAVASTVRIGNEIGLKNYKNIIYVGITNLALVTIFMFCCGVLFVIFSEELPVLFLRKEEGFEVVSIASKLLIVAAFFQIFDGLQVVTLGALRGLQDVKIPTIITFVAYFVIALPLGAYLAIYQDMKAFGMWIALGIGLGISASFLMLRFRYNTQRLLLSYDRIQK